MSKSKRRREIIKRNRLLVRQEGLAERDVKAAITKMAEDVANRITFGSVEASLQIVDSHQPNIKAALAKRLLQTATIFGERELERLEGVAPKSYYPNIAFGTGPVRGRDMRTPEAKNYKERFDGVIRQWVELHSLQRAITITGTLRAEVRGALEQGFDEGLGEAGVVALIRSKIGKDVSRTNAARVARTEMHTASEVGSSEAARATGLELMKEWASTEDVRTRPSHANADGQMVKMDEPFKIGSASLMMPGDANGPAKEIINCRCTALHHPIIGGEVIRDGVPVKKPVSGAVASPKKPSTDKAARAFVLENGRRDGVEFISGYDASTGKPFNTNKGKKSSVSLTPDMVEVMRRKDGRAVIHHNHPSSMAFSKEDLNLLQWSGMEKIFAHGHNGAQYAATSTSKTISKSLVASAYKKARSGLSLAILNDGVNVQEAGLLHAHIMGLILHKRGRIVYDYTLKGEMKEAAERHKKTIERIVG